MFTSFASRPRAGANDVSTNATPRRWLRLGVALISGFFTLAFNEPAHAGALPGAFTGNAYAIFANAKAGPVSVSLARSAFVSCACEGGNGQAVTNEVDQLAATNVLTAAVTQASTLSQKTAGAAQVQNISTVTGLNLFGGMITADAITAQAQITASSSTMTSSSSGSQFANLVIAGQQIPVSVPQNTVITLPGLGTVTLNKVTTSGNFRKSGSILVQMLTIQVSAKNAFNLPIGADIVVAHAIAGYNRKQPTDVFDGQAYGALANDAIGTTTENKIGKAAFVAIGCQGTAGKTKQAAIAKLNVAGILTADGGLTTAFAGLEGGSDVSRTTAQLATVNLLGGLITVNALQAVAQASVNNGVVTTSTDGSGFAGLSVVGIPVPLSVPPNTTLTLPGIGKVVVNEQKATQNGGVSVNGLHITVSTLNLLGLPVGADLVVAHANASANPF